MRSERHCVDPCLASFARRRIVTFAYALRAAAQDPCPSVCSASPRLVLSHVGEAASQTDFWGATSPQLWKAARPVLNLLLWPQVVLAQKTETGREWWSRLLANNATCAR